MSCMDLVVLILVVAGYIFYVAHMLSAAFSRVRKGPGQLPGAGLDLRYVLMDNREDFDYDLLWETQLPVLKFLRSAGSRGATVTRVEELYHQLARAYPEIFDGSTLSDWFAALQAAEIAACAEDRIRVTEKGLFILANLENRYAPQHLNSQPGRPRHGRSEMRLQNGRLR